METEYKDFWILAEKCEIDTFQTGFCDMKFILITFTIGSVSRIT